VFKAVKAQIVELCAVPESSVNADGKLAGYGLDSVRALDLLLAMEEEFDVELSEHDPELARVKTVAELVSFIDRARAE
jgi:acyl carrier protein